MVRLRAHPTREKVLPGLTANISWRIHKVGWLPVPVPRLSSWTAKAGPVSRNTRSGETRVALPGPLALIVGGKKKR